MRKLCVKRVTSCLTHCNFERLALWPCAAKYYSSATIVSLAGRFTFYRPINPDVLVYPKIHLLDLTTEKYLLSLGTCDRIVWGSRTTGALACSLQRHSLLLNRQVVGWFSCGAFLTGKIGVFHGESGHGTLTPCFTSDSNIAFDSFISFWTQWILSFTRSIIKLRCDSQWCCLFSSILHYICVFPTVHLEHQSVVDHPVSFVLQLQIATFQTLSGVADALHVCLQMYIIMF